MTLMIWLFLSIDISQSLLVSTVTDPLTWIVTSSAMLATLLFPCSILAWKIKNQLVYNPPDWDFQIREVPFGEYREMMDEYIQEYSHLISRVIWPDLLLLAVLVGLGISLPFVLRFSVFMLLLFPYLYGAVVIVFGMVLVHFLIHLISTEVTDDFPYFPPSRFKKLIERLSLIPGISWVGVRIAIGESGGFYTIRDPVIVCRVEAIESSARIDGIVNSRRELHEVTGYLNLAEEREPITRTVRSEREVGNDQILDLVKWLVQEYVNAKGHEDFLSDVIDELGLEI
ncbi:MAG: hypothetical protein ACFFAY_09835 [Promethearchaeota archaeon]